ncbi:MAG: hypothetical protein U5K84_12945 [Alkalibacterium sp.]|nr:hypothetical protein [Alkalibacterium sp.]
MNQDMTKGSPLRLILLFTLPLVVGNILQQMYQMADTYIVSQTLGVNAFSAAVGVHPQHQRARFRTGHSD